MSAMILQGFATACYCIAAFSLIRPTSVGDGRKINFIDLSVAAGLREIGRGDLVSFFVNKEWFAATLVALPGDGVRVDSAAIFINGAPISGREFAKVHFENSCRDEYTVPKGHVIVVPLVEGRYACKSIIMMSERDIVFGSYIIYPFDKFGSTGISLGQVPRLQQNDRGSK